MKHIFYKHIEPSVKTGFYMVQYEYCSMMEPSAGQNGVRYHCG